MYTWSESRVNRDPSTLQKLDRPRFYQPDSPVGRISCECHRTTGLVDPGERCTIAVRACDVNWCGGIRTSVKLIAGRYVPTSLKDRATLTTESTTGCRGPAILYNPTGWWVTSPHPSRIGHIKSVDRNREPQSVKRSEVSEIGLITSSTGRSSVLPPLAYWKGSRREWPSVQPRGL